LSAVLEPVLAIRPMQRSDLGRVTEIEEASYPHPWSRGIFSDCLRVGYACHVMALDDAVCGYGIVSEGVDEAHLLNLCICPQRRRQGLATAMLQFVIAEVCKVGKDRLFLEVRPSNRGAIALYRHHGFKVIGRRPGYYPSDDGREDATVMVLHLVPS
jgi:[ribosomal protein S18]-alanine N-acetyltransferase